MVKEKITLELITVDEYKYEIITDDRSDIPFILDKLNKDKFIHLSNYDGSGDLIINTQFIYDISIKYEKHVPVIKEIWFNKNETV